MTKVQIKNIVRKAYKIFLGLLFILFLLIAAFFVVINLPSTKDYLAKRGIEELNKEFKTNISAETVEIDYVGRLILHKVVIKDHHQLDFIKAEKIQASIDFWEMIQDFNSLSFNHIQMDKPDFKVITYKGEAFDKIGKILGLDYPAGLEIDTLAKTGNPHKFKFPISRMDGFDFSYSGIKTAVLYFIQKQTKENPKFIEENLNDICASVQETIVRSLINTTKKCLEKTGIKQIAIAGGVSANSHLRNELLLLEKEGYSAFIPKFEYTTDNAAMISMVGSLKYQQKDFTNFETFATNRMEF